MKAQRISLNFRYTNEVLTNLLAVKTSMCGRRFEVKINDVLFVGYPMDFLSDQGNKTKTSTMISFNVVFALKVLIQCSLGKTILYKFRIELY